MSDGIDPNSLQNPSPDPTRRGGSFSPSWRQRSKSINLREEGAEGEDPDSLMDPATQSLSDALRITYRFVQLAVLVLFGLYALSGFRSVAEGERGIRLLFGKVQDKDIPPGFRFSWPEPFGELIKVQTGSLDLLIDDDFFPELSADEKKMVVDKGLGALGDGGRDKLDPELDGSNLMGDGNLAHTRWSIRYHRENPEKVIENIDPDSERLLVLGAVKRGIVRAAASVTIDELLKLSADPSRGAGEYRPVEVVAREVAQKTLDDMQSGIRLDVVSMTAKMAPRRTARWFNLVNTASAERQTFISDAVEARTAVLTATAGEAAVEIVRQIDAYDKALALNDDDAAAEHLAIIDGLLASEEVVIDGKKVNLPVYGQVTRIITDAESDRARIVNRLRGETASFGAKRELYTNNRQVFLNAEWADAYGAFLAIPSVQQLFLPRMGADGRIVIMLNRDPEVNNRIVRNINEEAAKKAKELRDRNADRERYEQKIEAIKSTEQ